MSKVGVLICSCDAYQVCWKPLIYSFDKYWKNCEYTKYVVSNFLSEKFNNVEFIKVGDHHGWGADTRKALTEINCDYLIYFQEDYFLDYSVNNEAIKSHVRYMEDKGLDYLKISYDGINRDKYRIGDTIYCNNPIDKRYAVNTAVAIWKKELLEKLAIPGYTGWDFEYTILRYIKDNSITIKSETLLTSAIKEYGLTMIPGFAIQRGKWTLAGVRFLRENGFEDLISRRKTQNKFYSWCYYQFPSWGPLKFVKIALLKFLRYIKIN